MDGIDHRGAQERPSEEQTIVGSFEKNSQETVCAALGSFRGYQLAHVRVYVENDDGELIPTKAGVAVRVEQLHELRRLVDELIAAEYGLVAA